MKIGVDIFGGDNAPLAVLVGCAEAKKEYGVEILACGKKEEIERIAAENGISLEGIEILNADRVMPMEADSTEIIKEYSTSSMAVLLKALAEGKCDAAVSAGSTGALVVGATFIVKRIRGIKRAALAPIIPTTAEKYLLIDSGANVECRPEMLVQFGVMGSIYMEKVEGVVSPRVGLINVGTEECKGAPLQKEAYELLGKAPLNFVGNIEARDVPSGKCDVAVADGFTGNIVLKLTEGTAMGMMKEIKGILYSNLLTKLAALVLKKGLYAFKKKMDYTEYGGAPLLGIAKPVIKAHGSSDAKAFKNAIRQAAAFTQSGAIEAIAAAVKEMKSQGDGENE